MALSSLLITGATGLMGGFFLQRLAQMQLAFQIHCLVRSRLSQSQLQHHNLELRCWQGNCESQQDWTRVLAEIAPQTIVHIASIRHVPVLLASVADVSQQPRLIIIGTTGVFSKYNQSSAEYHQIEQHLAQYPGQSCLLRPTMIYGSHHDKNLHKLIRFCDRYRFFPVFGSGQRLLQPVHADDLAQAILAVLLNSDIQGEYNLSGQTVVTFLELLMLVERLLAKPFHRLRVPYSLGLWLAMISEQVLRGRSPVRREQILRLQEDKAYSYAAAAQDFGYTPRSLELGLAQEMEILRLYRII